MTVSMAHVTMTFCMTAEAVKTIDWTRTHVLTNMSLTTSTLLRYYNLEQKVVALTPQVLVAEVALCPVLNEVQMNKQLRHADASEDVLGVA